MADPFEKGSPFEGFNRWMDAEPPSWPVAVVNLLDALREYLRSNDQIGQELLEDGEITREQYEAGMAEDDPLRETVKRLEGCEVDPWLRGIVKWKRQDG